MEANFSYLFKKKLSEKNLSLKHEIYTVMLFEWKFLNLIFQIAPLPAMLKWKSN